MTRTTAGGAIFARLKALGVTHVFTNSGTDFPPIIEGLAAAEAAGADLPAALIIPHEHAAMGMAHGAWLATGRPQAVILHTNVGLANGAIGAINAATDQVPIIIMSGRTPVTESGRFGARTVPIGWGQEMRDQTALVRESVKWDYELRFPEQIGPLLDRAAAIAQSSPMGPVYLSLPREVLCEEVELGDAPIPYAPAKATPPAAEIARAAAILAAAERPLIVAQRGAGDRAGWEALARLAADWAIPVSDYWAVANAISQEHPSYIGPDLGAALAGADAALAIDSLAPWSPGEHALRDDLRVVQLGPDPLMSRTPVRQFRADVSLAGATGPSLVALEAAMRPLLAEAGARIAARRPQVAAWAAAARDAAARAGALPDGAPMTKGFVSARIGAAIRGRDAAVISELGAPLLPLGLAEPGQWRQEPHAGGLGWGFPCALGVKLAAPERLVVGTMGDGSYIFSNPVACHQIAEAHGLAPLIVILNNAEWGAVRQSVVGLYPGGAAARANRTPLTSLEPSPDFAAVARASRAFARRVERAGDLAPALAEAIEATEAGRLALLDVSVAG
ncbi:thiamine pyrophosphate-requiring protein [Pikeienuella sp. HZG-20]|uniref:thiamine pyrophosphate-requiring protein n=1 Tax=Paludibacillus litoralis TaxID=3133267 RepID=UPI0030ECB765